MNKKTFWVLFRIFVFATIILIGFLIWYQIIINALKQMQKI